MLKKFSTFFLLITTSFAFAQSGLDDLLSSASSLEELQLEGSSNVPEQMKSYDYFTKNSYESTVKQLEYANEFSEEEFIKSELEDARLELAIQLCEKDPRACFLIENYRDSMPDRQVSMDPDDLKIYGVDIFNGYPLAFQGVPNVAVNNDYLIQPGDVVEITLTGPVNLNRTIQVNQNGYISISNVGSIPVAGKNISDVTDSLRQFISTKRPGTFADIFLKNISPIQVFVTGAVRFPSNYNLGGLSTPINAVISSGGFLNNASLREIKLFRDKKEISTIDLYDLLVYGKTAEINLKGGDSLVVGGSSNLVSIYGNVNRPAKYEIKDGETIRDLLDFSLGVDQYGDINNIIVQRQTLSGQMSTIEVANIDEFRLKKNDLVFVGKSEGEKINYAMITGAIRKPGLVALQEPSPISNFVNYQTDLLEDTYLGLIIVKRFNRESRSFRFEKYDIDDLDRIVIHPKDEVFFLSEDDIKFINSSNLYEYINSYRDQPNQVFVSQSTNNNIDNSCLLSLGRYSDDGFISSIKIKLDLIVHNIEHSCTPLLSEESEIIPLLLASSVPVVGSVSRPGLYPASSSLKASRLLSFAGGLDNLEGNNVNFEVGTNQNISQYELQSLASISNVIFLNVKRNFKSLNNGFVKLVGEFEFPGVYPIEGITTLSEIYRRAGGLNQLAFPLGGILTRESIKVSEEKALQRAQAELAEIFSVGVASGILQQQSRDIIELINLKNRVDSAKATGRLVAELNPTIIERDPSKDIILRDGDIIYMPEITNTVTIMGDVLNPVTVPYNASHDLNDYITLAGGYTSSADKSKTYAILPNGASVKIGGSFRAFQGNDLMPGSTIIVPKQARPLSGLSLVEVITPILANLSLTAASIAAINN